MQVVGAVNVFSSPKSTLRALDLPTKAMAGRFEGVPGGWSVWQLVTDQDDVQKVADSVRGEIEAAAGKKFKVYQAEKYRSQVVRGINYKISVMISKLEIEAYQNVNIIEQSSLKAWKIESASGQCDQQLEQSSEPVTWSDLKPATADIQQIAESCRADIEKASGKKFKVYNAQDYQYHNDYGTTYKIIVMVGECVSIVYQDIGQAPAQLKEYEINE